MGIPILADASTKDHRTTAPFVVSFGIQISDYELLTLPHHGHAADKNPQNVLIVSPCFAEMIVIHTERSKVTSQYEEYVRDSARVDQ